MLSDARPQTDVERLIGRSECKRNELARIYLSQLHGQYHGRKKYSLLCINTGTIGVARHE